MVFWSSMGPVDGSFVGLPHPFSTLPSVGQRLSTDFWERVLCTSNDLLLLLTQGVSLEPVELLNSLSTTGFIEAPFFGSQQEGSLT